MAVDERRGKYSRWPRRVKSSLRLTAKVFRNFFPDAERASRPLMFAAEETDGYRLVEGRTLAKLAAAGKIGSIRPAGWPNEGDTYNSISGAARSEPNLQFAITNFHFFPLAISHFAYSTWP